MTLALLGLANALPEHSISQDDAAEFGKLICCTDAEQERVLPVLYRRTRVERRHSVVLTQTGGGRAVDRQSFYRAAEDEADRGPSTFERMEHYERTAGELAVRAAEAALADSHVKASSITHLVTVSCTGFSAPGVDIRLIKGLNLPRSVARSHIGFMGCHGALNGLRVAKSICEADPNATALVCAVELCSLHQQYGWDPEQIVANALFADGAAAAVCRAPGNHNGARVPWKIVSSGSAILDDCEDAMSWKIGNSGFTMTLSPQVPELIAQHVRPWLEEWLGKSGRKLEEIQSWAVHPGGPRILAAFVESVGLPPEAIEVSREVLAECGNMSSPTLMFILNRLAARGARGPCVAIGFGPGLAIEAALLE